jgi:DUF4097 and DUF4098 domain-containing protein YvlB
MRSHQTVPLVLAAALALSFAGTAVAQDRSSSASRTQERRVDREQSRRYNQRETQTERTTRTFNIGTDGEIDVSNIAGNIVITAVAGGTATIEIVKNARAESTDAARVMLPLVTVDVTERGPRVEIKTRYPRSDEMRREDRRNINVEVAFSIAAPANTRIIAHSISGNIIASDVKGALALETVSGNVKIERGGRTVTGKTISGNVDVTDTTVDGMLSAGSISGTVKVQRARVASLNATSVSGSVILDDIDSDRVEAQAISGDVLFSGDFAANGRYELSSHSGNVRLAVGAKTGFQLEATSFSGNITTDLPLTVQSERRGNRGALRARFGNGSAIVELTSFSGSILIGKR